MDTLQKIVQSRQKDIEQLKQAYSEEEQVAAALRTDNPPSFRQAIESSGERPAIIAEIKKASPSKGIMQESFNPAELAHELEAHGASALSVLTEPHYFEGCSEYLRQAAEQVSMPILCKDFIIDSFQIYLARQWGASAILLIAAVLTPKQFSSLCTTAQSCGLDVLAEAHNNKELEMILTHDYPIVGLNSRNLQNFETDLSTTETLLKQVPQDRIVVAESGISDHQDIVHLTACGANAFLIGEALMRSSHPGETLQQLVKSQNIRS